MRSWLTALVRGAAPAPSAPGAAATGFGMAALVSIILTLSSPAEIGGRQLVLELAGSTDLLDLAVQHDPRPVGHTEHGPSELLDQHDRDAFGGDLLDHAVELFDD